MTFLQFLHLLRARHRIVIAAIAIGVVLALLLVVFSPRSYDATAQVLVNVRAPETVGSQSLQDQLAPDYLSTQVDILRSRRVALRVAKALNLDSAPSVRRAFTESDATSFEDYVVEIVQRGLTVAPAAASRVISLTYTARDPQLAASAANAYAEAYRTVTLQLQAEPARQSAEWYDGQARAVQAQLLAAQQALSARQRTLAVAADADQTDSDVNRLNNLSGQLAAAQAQQAALHARAGGGALPDIVASPVVQGLQADLAKLQAQRAQLASYAGPNNIDLIQLDRQIGGLQGKLDEQRALVARSATAAASQGVSGVAQLSGAVAAQRQRTIAARSNRDELGPLQEQVTNLKQTYEQIMARRAQLGILSEGSQTNVALLSAASPPSRPAWPKPLLLLAIGILLGGVAGAALAVVLELIDQRLRAPDDIEAWLGIPNLGAIRMIEDRSARARLGGSLRRLLPGPAADGG